MRLAITALLISISCSAVHAQNPEGANVPSGNSILATPAQPVAPSAPPAADVHDAPATIYLYRPRRFEGSALKPSVFVDGTKAGSMHNGSSIKISVPPGSHRIYSTDKSTGLDLAAKPGETYYIRIDIQTGFWKGYGSVTLVDPQEGKYEVAKVPEKEPKK